ncbi:MAG: hypothetical protein HQ474_00150 [Flammeovirgaceae bacterium]|jgi:hypothetical protein|nr:hypothetical protein [Flammeovirgaceae bacterium]
MKYYILTGSTWSETELTTDRLSYRWIKLYNDDLSVKGIGMIKPPLNREEFQKLKESWSETLANLNYHLEEDQF